MDREGPEAPEGIVASDGQARSLLRATLEATADGILVVDRAGVTVALNRRFAQMWCIPDEILAARDDARMLDYVARQLRDPLQFRARVEELYAHPEAEGYDQLAFVDGRVYERYSRPQWVGGVAVGRVWSFRDVTQKLATERELARRVAMAEDVIAVAMAAMRASSVDEVAEPLLAAACRNASWSAAAILIVDPSTGELCGTRFGYDRLPPRCARLLGELAALRLKPGQGFGGRVLESRRWEWERDFAHSASPLAGAAREARVAAAFAFPAWATRGIVAVLGGFAATDAPVDSVIEHAMFALGATVGSLIERTRSAAEREQLLRRAELTATDATEAVRVREEMLDIVGHELKTPIAALQVAVQNVARIGEKQIGRLTRMVETLLDASRVAAGRLVLERAEVDLAQLVREVVEQLSPELRRAGVEVRLALAPVRAGCDRTRIEQVVTNLVSNAIKYGEGRPIELSLDELDAVARLRVTDHGVGIAPEDLGTIFDRFERGRAQRRHAGLGLGLYVARRLVEAHGGRLSVESRLGGGSTFTVELPRSESVHHAP